MPNPPLVLFAEDDNEDWMLIEDTLHQCNGSCRTERVLDGVELLKRLQDETQPLPDVILMDIKMPKKNGVEALEDIRGISRLRHIPVIIMTTSKTEADIYRAYTKGANSYVVKPVSFDAMKSVLMDIRHYWTEIASLPRPQHEPV